MVVTRPELADDTLAPMHAIAIEARDGLELVSHLTLPSGSDPDGIADPDKIAIAGGSYGGYATLIGVSFTPDSFACGVDIVGPSSLVTLIESFPEYRKP